MPQFPGEQEKSHIELVKNDPEKARIMEAEPAVSLLSKGLYVEPQITPGVARPRWLPVGAELGTEPMRTIERMSYT